MERIKKALERAREERAEYAGQDSKVSNRRIPRVGSVQIDYKRTRVINVREESLLKNRIVAGLEDHRAAAAYKILRTQILRRMQPEGWKTLAITSAAPMEGKSLTSVNLAISIAKHFRNTVLLADIDLRQPSISSYFGCDSAPGLTDHLLEGASLEDVLVNPGIERLVVLPAGSPVKNSSELMRSSEMHALMDELKTRYEDRLIIFDLPPMLVGDDALSFLPYVDCVLLVIEDGRTHPSQLTRVIELLREFRLIGSVLNKARGKSETNDYYSQYY